MDQLHYFTMLCITSYKNHALTTKMFMDMVFNVLRGFMKAHIVFAVACGMQ